MTKFYHGQKAVQKVREVYGISCMPEDMALVILHEGFCEDEYLDDKGVVTTGVGQTGKFKDIPFPEVFEIFKSKAKKLTPKYDSYPPEVQAAILSATYRGDWGASRKTRALLDQGDYLGASREFLNNEDYLKRKQKNPRDGVVKRMEHISKALASLDNKSDTQEALV